MRPGFLEKQKTPPVRRTTYEQREPARRCDVHTLKTVAPLALSVSLILGGCSDETIASYIVGGGPAFSDEELAEFEFDDETERAEDAEARAEEEWTTLDPAQVAPAARPTPPPRPAPAKPAAPPARPKPTPRAAKPKPAVPQSFKKSRRCMVVSFMQARRASE